jgi:hypothetical protein
MAISKQRQEELKRRDQRAREWKLFRRDHLFSQRNLCEALRCSRRTVVAIESRETLCPHPDLLRRFRDLKRKHERSEEIGLRWTA